MSNTDTKVLVREGTYSSNLEESCRGFSWNFVQIPHSLMELYTLESRDPEYDLSVSQPINCPPADYAVIFSVISGSDDLNERLAQEFQEKSGIGLRRIPCHIES